MAIVIGPGINIGGGITISPPGSAIRAALSPTGQTAFDAAATDGWFAVSSTDYGNVLAGLSGTSTIGYSNANLSSAATGFSQNFGATLNNTNATVNAGSYILGLASKGNGTGTLVFRPYVSTTFRGTYTTIGTGNCTMTSNTIFYWIRKNPAAPVAATKDQHPADIAPTAPVKKSRLSADNYYFDADGDSIPAAQAQDASYVFASKSELSNISTKLDAAIKQKDSIAKAEIKNGILTITLERKEDSKPKKVKIKVG